MSIWRTFCRQGYVVCRNVISPALIHDLQDTLGPESHVKQPVPTLLLSCLTTFLSTALPNSVLKPLVLSSSEMTVFRSATWDPRRRSSTFWHRDELVHSPVVTMPLTRWTTANGATEMYAGSHRHSTKRWYDSLDVEHCEMLGLPPLPRPPIVSRRSQTPIRSAEMKPGDLLLTHPLLFHRRPLMALKPTSVRDGVLIVFNRSF